MYEYVFEINLKKLKRSMFLGDDNLYLWNYVLFVDQTYLVYRHLDFSCRSLSDLITIYIYVWVL